MLEHVVCLGESCLSQVNNSHRANVFAAGVANLSRPLMSSFLCISCIVCYMYPAGQYIGHA